ncbi:MAG TPA: hypothetical protein VGO22_17130 [Pseudorhizobium sp.]|nr:hypothetical protein [Pseudorhizobium sp.]
MTAQTDLIAELVRAANTVSRLTVLERQRLLIRAYFAVVKGREEIDIHPAKADTDSAIDLLSASKYSEDMTDEYIAEVLLDGAEMLRVIKIALDAKDEVNSGGTRH